MIHFYFTHFILYLSEFLETPIGFLMALLLEFSLLIGFIYLTIAYDRKLQDFFTYLFPVDRDNVADDLY